MVMWCHSIVGHMNLNESEPGARETEGKPQDVEVEVAAEVLVCNPELPSPSNVSSSTCSQQRPRKDSRTRCPVCEEDAEMNSPVSVKPSRGSCDVAHDAGSGQSRRTSLS